MAIMAQSTFHLLSPYFLTARKPSIAAPFSTPLRRLQTHFRQLTGNAPPSLHRRRGESGLRYRVVLTFHPFQQRAEFLRFSSDSFTPSIKIYSIVTRSGHFNVAGVEINSSTDICDDRHQRSRIRLFGACETESVIRLKRRAFFDLFSQPFDAGTTPAVLTEMRFAGTRCFGSVRCNCPLDFS